MDIEVKIGNQNFTVHDGSVGFNNASLIYIRVQGFVDEDDADTLIDFIEGDNNNLTAQVKIGSQTLTADGMGIGYKRDADYRVLFGFAARLGEASTGVAAEMFRTDPAVFKVMSIEDVFSYYGSQ